MGHLQLWQRRISLICWQGVGERQVAVALVCMQQGGQGHPAAAQRRAACMQRPLHRLGAWRAPQLQYWHVQVPRLGSRRRLQPDRPMLAGKHVAGRAPGVPACRGAHTDQRVQGCDLACTIGPNWPHDGGKAPGAAQ